MFNPAPQYYSPSQFPGQQPPQYVNPMGIAPGQPAWNQAVQPGAPQMQQPVTAPAPQPVPAQPDPLAQGVQSWLDAKGVDIGNFEGGIGGLLDSLYQAAEDGFAAKDAAAAAQNTPAPVATPNEPIDLRRWQDSVQTTDDGRIVPKDNVSVPYEVIQRFNEVHQMNQDFRFDPEGFLRQRGGLFEDMINERVQQGIQKFQQQQLLDNSYESFIGQHGHWMYDGDPSQKKLTELGKQYMEQVQDLENKNVPAEHVLQTALHNLIGQTALNEAMAARNQPQPQPQFQQSGEQPRQPNGQFAPMPPQEQQFQPQAPVQPQIPTHPATQQQFAPQNTVAPQAPAAAPQPQLATTATAMPQPQVPPQQTFLQESGIGGAVLEPTQRSDANAHAIGSVEGDTDGFMDMTDFAMEQAQALGIVDNN